MKIFHSDQLRIAYLDEGEGEPILLIHGFASNASTNWVYPGWVSMLVKAGRRVIAIDNRGHGASDKPLDPTFYPAPSMAADCARLLAHLGIVQADVMGYSMGARIAAFMALEWPTGVRRLVLAGMGMALVRGMNNTPAIVAALEAPYLHNIDDPTGRAFRQFAEATGGDLQALAACLRASRERVSKDQIGRLQVPVLIAVGTKDEIAGSPHELAEHIPGAKVLEIAGRDHMLAVGDKHFKAGVLQFLQAAG